MTDLRFYISDLTYLDAEGRKVPLELQANGRWQGAGLTLIDLEDAEGDCRNGTNDTNTKVLGLLPAGDYAGIRFTVAVPFGLNHADPLQAPMPLDDSTMHWHWRSGYKFLRAGYRRPGDSFWVHLGSAGCEGTVHNITGCRFENRFDVDLSDFRPGDTVAFDFAELVAAAANEGDADCSSGPAEESCSTTFRGFGLDFETGRQVEAQSLFRVYRP